MSCSSAVSEESGSSLHEDRPARIGGTLANRVGRYLGTVMHIDKSNAESEGVNFRVSDWHKRVQLTLNGIGVKVCISLVDISRKIFANA